MYHVKPCSMDVVTPPRAPKIALVVNVLIRPFRKSLECIRFFILSFDILSAGTIELSLFLFQFPLFFFCYSDHCVIVNEFALDKLLISLPILGAIAITRLLPSLLRTTQIIGPELSPRRTGPQKSRSAKISFVITTPVADYRTYV